MNLFLDVLNAFVLRYTQTRECMDIYTQKSRWKLSLAIAGLVIIAISIWYTNELAGKLRDEEYKKVSVFREAYERFNINDPNEDVTLPTDIIKDNTTIPIILTDNKRKIILDARNFDNDTDMVAIRKVLDRLIKADSVPLAIEIPGQTPQLLYYTNSKILTQLTFYPFYQFILIAAFIGFGYYAFSSARRGEQNRVWVGMAKETAHQLGTPVAAIMAWVEHLRGVHEGDEGTQEVLNELHNDVTRLDLIADRFSKIGSVPELVSTNIYQELERSREYMQRRAPKKVVFSFPGVGNEPLYAQLNAHLFEWVVENLLRNALDAMDGKGTIGAEVYEEGRYVCIDISDTGSGIPASKFHTVFQPGYTTKKRGWGLGLSLAKRIIENYHSGKIFVKKSVTGEGTTFTIKLMKG